MEYRMVVVVIDAALPPCLTAATAAATACGVLAGHVLPCALPCGPRLGDGAGKLSACTHAVLEEEESEVRSGELGPVIVIIIVSNMCSSWHREALTT